MKIPKLKNCPFCGGRAEFATFESNYMKIYYIHCTKCGMMTGTSHERLILQAKRWNRRVDE